jgi:hypothetical protein
MVRSWVESRRRAKEDILATALKGQSAVNIVPMAAKPAANETASSSIAPMATTQAVAQPALRSSVKSLISAVQGIGAPLRGAVSEVAAGLRERGQPISQVQEAKAFALLVQQVTKIARTTALTIGMPLGTLTAQERAQHTQLVEAVSDIAGAYYRASGVLNPSPLVGQIMAAITQIALDNATQEDLIPNNGKSGYTRTAIDLLKAMPSVVHACARYSYGRTPAVLMGEVAMELHYMTAETTSPMLPQGASLEEWYSLHAALMQTAGQLYAEAHFAVAEQVQHGSGQNAPNKEVPMDKVWETLATTFGQITRFATHLAGTSAQKAQLQSIEGTSSDQSKYLSASSASA